MKFDRPETSLLDRRIAQGYVCVYCHGWTRRKHNHWHQATQSSRSVQICIPCNAWVGLHPVTNVPLGVVADVKTRNARSKAHDAFDAIWKQGILSRKRAYFWLSEQMVTTPEMTHIGCSISKPVSVSVKLATRLSVKISKIDLKLTTAH